MTTHRVGVSPFHPIQSFTALACGDERVTLKEPAMFDLQLAIDKAQKLRDTLVMAKGAQVSGGDPEPFLADAKARLPEVANALNFFADPIDAPADEAAMAAVEGTTYQEAAE